MAGEELSWEQLKQKTYFGRPHVVILGAGASLAALPEGDPSGAVLPVMNNLADVLELTNVIEQNGLKCHGRNFEDVYFEVAENSKLAGLKELIEERVSEYFSALRLPQTPTIYDYLVLSLREKDFIATFNWDPFLYRACWRNHTVAPMPKCLYLHGCSIVGFCLEHRAQGLVGTPCSACGKPFTPGPLLYPVRNKDYTSHAYISAQWKSLRFALKNAYVVTIFGYGAPSSDAAAVELMSEAWGNSDERNLEEIEIINVLPEDKLRLTWSRFIHTHHYQTTKDYFSSLLGIFPRRSCEAMWEQLMEVNFLEHRSVPRFVSLEELRAWAAEIRSYEEKEGT